MDRGKLVRLLNFSIYNCGNIHNYPHFTLFVRIFICESLEFNKTFTINELQFYPYSGHLRKSSQTSFQVEHRNHYL